MGQLCGSHQIEETNAEHSLKALLQNAFDQEKKDYLQDIEMLSTELHHKWNLNNGKTMHQIGSYLREIYSETNQHEHSFDTSIYYLLYLHCKKYIIDNQSKFKQNAIKPNAFYYCSSAERGANLSLAKPAKFSRKYEYGIYNKVYCIKKPNINVSRDISIVFDLLKKDIMCLKAFKNCSFIINLYYVLQNKHNIYFISDWLAGGDLKYHLNMNTRFSKETTKFYSAQILLALQYIHRKGYVHRDLILENISLQHNGYIKICDFTVTIQLKDVAIHNSKHINNLAECIISNWSKHIIEIFPAVLLHIILKYKGKTEVSRGYAGTPGYVAPECILGHYYDQSVDIFSFGVLMYRFICGNKPFKYAVINRSNMRKPPKAAFDRHCIEKTVLFPDQYFDKTSRNIVKAFLCKNVKHRLGNNENSSMDEIFEHPYFDGIDWGGLQEQTIVAPFVPIVDNYMSDLEQGRYVGDQDIKTKRKKDPSVDLEDNSFNMYYVYEEHLQHHVMDILQQVVSERKV